MAGNRIRERRILSGLRQSELARNVGISASYLNLIEHNKRRIGGKTLLKLAEVLDVEPGYLAEGAEAALIAGLREAAGAAEAPAVELERVEEFAGRFPGWAGLLTELSRRSEALARQVRTLTDRLAHDPHLADSLHEVISTVTAIRAASAILVETEELDPAWQNRFHRNIDEDSRRLAEGAETLVRYLEQAPDTEADLRSPQDVMHAFLSERGFHIPALEGEAGADADAVEAVLGAADGLTSDAARSLTRAVLDQYRADAQRAPMAAILELIGIHGIAPDTLAPALGVDLACVIRRLATLPESEVGPVGLVTCDLSGALTFRKPIEGFDMPRAAGACALWPLFRALAQPQQPISARLRQAGREGAAVRALTVAEHIGPPGFDRPALLRAHMLVLPDYDAGQRGAPVRDVGATCRICPLPACAARREPSILAEGF